jgi:glycosyltransferase involved in cell wall biosynthesis
MGRPVTATFVMPFYGDRPEHRRYLDVAIDGLRQQTDPEWHLVIVDDASPLAENADHLRRLDGGEDGRITVLFQPANRGQGACRNVGIRWAAARGADIILLHDADDVSHPRRLDLTRHFFIEQPAVDFVYSTFIVIDEDGRTVPAGQLTPSVGEVLEPHRRHPVHGPDGWIRMGLDTGFTTLTSTIGLRTHLALDQPFAEVRGSEDMNTYFRMAAASTGLEYIPSIPVLYRIPQRAGGSSDRARIGGDYYQLKADNDRAGFAEATRIAVRLGKIEQAEVPGLLAGFLRRLSETMAKEDRPDLARELLREAESVRQPDTVPAPGRH